MDSGIERSALALDVLRTVSPIKSLWPDPLDLEMLSEREPLRPRFIVDDYLPCGYASLLAGHGGVGKSGIALHLAVCIGLGIPFFGVPVDRRMVLYLSCEDRENILHWRLTRICNYLGVDMADLRGWLDVIDLVGRDTILWSRDPYTGNAVTPAFVELERRIKSSERQVIFVDGISDTYGGNENDKAQVKQYVNLLLGTVPPDDGAVLLIGHVAKPTAAGIATTEGYSGTTGWHNAVRARWYLHPEVRSGEDGTSDRTGGLVLELQKSNLGRTDQSIKFRWDDDVHLFVGQVEPKETTFDREHRKRIEREGTRDRMRA